MKLQPFVVTLARALQRCTGQQPPPAGYTDTTVTGEPWSLEIGSHVAWIFALKSFYQYIKYMLIAPPQ